MRLELNIKNYFAFVIFPIVFIIVVMLFYSLDYLEQKIVSTKTELHGLDEIVDLHQLVLELQQLRGISNIPHPDDKLLRKKQTLQKSIEARVERCREKESDHDINISPYAERAVLLQDIMNLSSSHTLTHQQRFLLFSSIIDSMFYVIKNIAFHTGLTFDDDAASFFLIDTITVQLPHFMEYYGKLRGISLGLCDDEKKKAEDLHMLHNQLDKVQERLGVLKYNITIIADHIGDPAVLKEKFARVLKGNTELVRFINANVFDKEVSGDDYEMIFDVLTGYIDNLVDLHRYSRDVLKQRLEKKIANERYNQYFLLSGGLLLLLLIVYSHLKYYRINRRYIKIINESNRNLEQMSITDALTGLYNRRFFDKIFSRSVRQVRRDRTSMVFIMADIDCFKEYNDTYGHHYGDNALCEVASVLKKSLQRPGDYAFRLGGEEFGVIMMDMTQGSAAEFAMRLCRSVEELEIEHGKNSCSEYITVSMGMIYVDSDCRLDEEAIYKEADNALYSAKKLGKNRVKMYAPTREASTQDGAGRSEG